MAPLICSAGGGDQAIEMKVELKADPDGINGAALGTAKRLIVVL